MKVEFNNYQIWIGSYHLGQGFDESTEPQMVGEEIAINFQVACFKHQVKTTLESVEMQEKIYGIVQHQSMEWFYNRGTNSNGWTGKYFESREEALESFKK